MGNTTELMKLSIPNEFERVIQVRRDTLKEILDEMPNTRRSVRRVEEYTHRIKELDWLLSKVKR